MIVNQGVPSSPWGSAENLVPSELRYIMFRPDEVVEAVKEYRRRMGTPLPHGGVVQCGPESGSAVSGTVSFRITFAPEGVKGLAAPENEMLLIEGSVLAAALILYCRDHRIPMSASADKTLERMGNQVCLVAKFNPKQISLPQHDHVRL